MLTTMYFGYAFDFSMNKIQKATYGTHEINHRAEIWRDPAKDSGGLTGTLKDCGLRIAELKE